MQYGLPSWNELAYKLFKRCLDSNNYQDIKLLESQPYSALQKVTIACNILDKKNKKKSGQQEIINILSSKPENGYAKNLHELSQCLKIFDCPILTTNADTFLDEQPEFTDYEIFNNFVDESSKLKSHSIVHMHGSIKDENNMIFTAKQYLSNYHHNGKLCKNLKSLLHDSSKYIIILGYGANEFELLRQMLEQFEKQNSSNIYMLREYFDYEEIKYITDCEYYGIFGINIIPYSISKNGYNAFLTTLTDWKNQITDYLPADKDRELKEALNSKPKDETLNMVAQEIIKGNSAAVKMLANSSSQKEWIDKLYELDI